MSASADFWRLPRLEHGELTRAERVTLDTGSAIVISAVAVGTQLGGWPLWSVALAMAGYVAWTVLYSEATLQLTRDKTSFATRRLDVTLTAEPTPPPG